MKKEKKSNGNGKKSKIKMVSIRKKLVWRIFVALFTLTLAMFAMVLTSSSVLTQDTLRITSQQMAVNAANSLSTQISIFHIYLDEMTNFAPFSDHEANQAGVVQILEEKSAEYWCYMSFADVNGLDYRTGQDVTAEAYFQRAIAGDKYVSSPQSVDGSIFYTFSIPAQVNGETIGVLSMMSDYNYIYSLVEATSVGETGRTYVINTNDEVIIDEDILTGMQVGAAQHMNKSKSHLQLESRALKGEGNSEGGVGFGNFFEGGMPRVGGFAPVPNTDGWILITTTETFEFLNNITLVILGTLAISVTLMLLFSAILSFNINNFVAPITQCVERISALSEGDIHTPVPEFRSNDEAGLLAQSTKGIVDSMATLIRDEREMLGEMARGNFAVTSQNPEAYIGDFAPLLDSLTVIISNMNRTLSRISQASEQMTHGAQDMASSSSSLADGVVKQETSTKELSVVLDLISQQVSTSAQRANHARQLTQRNGEEMRQGNASMKELQSAMEDISESSLKIENIIKAIEDISFQTNILALNAAVEAARAGAAGSGFAVVADEVRNLATRSADNVKETSVLLSTTLKAVDNGTKVANQTAKSLKSMEQGVEEAIVAIQDIAQAMEEQSHEIEKITENMEEITGVITNTSETSKESEDISQKLSNQATTLRELVNLFQLQRDLNQGDQSMDLPSPEEE